MIGVDYRDGIVITIGFLMIGINSGYRIMMGWLWMM